MNLPILTIFDLALAASLLCIYGLLSIVLQLGLVKSVIIATLRMVVQLILMGWVLTWLFNQQSLFWTLLAAIIMITFAGYEILARQKYRLKGLWSYTLGTLSMLMAASLVTIFALTSQIQPEPWYDPRFAIPLLGMILGNTMTGISLGLNTFNSQIIKEKASIEAQLALGADRFQALLPIVQQALYNALIPILNTMAATGVVAIPGMMTGQILAGIEPMHAIKYQMLILFLIAGGTILGSLIAVIASVYRVTDHRHRLRLDYLSF